MPKRQLKVILQELEELGVSREYALDAVRETLHHEDGGMVTIPLRDAWWVEALLAYDPEDFVIKCEVEAVQPADTFAQPVHLYTHYVVVPPESDPGPLVLVALLDALKGAFKEVGPEGRRRRYERAMAEARRIDNELRRVHDQWRAKMA